MRSLHILGMFWMKLSMALKALNKVNGRLKFLNHKNKFLTPTISRMLSMLLSSHILIIPALHGTLTSMKK